jgi:hypothetical protein
MKILVACEESQAVTIELRRLGHEAYSCDLEPCSGGHPEWHLQQDVLPLLMAQWDMIIAFPPCTHLSNVGIGHRRAKAEDGRLREGIDFFMRFATADCPKIAIENPVGIMQTYWRRPDQVIEPWMFGDEASKKTCLWLKGLPPLMATALTTVQNTMFYKSGPKAGKPICWVDRFTPGPDRAKLRSKTFPGIARAMAEHWAG